MTCACFIAFVNKLDGVTQHVNISMSCQTNIMHVGIGGIGITILTL